VFISVNNNTNFKFFRFFSWVAKLELNGWVAKLELKVWVAKLELDGRVAKLEMEGRMAKLELVGWVVKLEASAAQWACARLLQQHSGFESAEKI
jgi:hypothetical protein